MWYLFFVIMTLARVATQPSSALYRSDHALHPMPRIVSCVVDVITRVHLVAVFAELLRSNMIEICA